MHTLHNITSFELTRCDWFPLIDSSAILRIWQVYVNVHTLVEEKKDHNSENRASIFALAE